MNFNLPIDLTHLKNDRLWLQPFEQCTEAQLEEFIHKTCVDHPEVWDLYPRGPFNSPQDYRDYLNVAIGSDPKAQAEVQFFAIYLKAGTITRHSVSGPETFAVAHGTFAGTTGLIGASLEKSKVEIGHVIILPQFQRTFVNTHAHCLLLKHLLDPLDQGGMNLRRVQWTTSSENKASIKAGERLGMLFEGIHRWDMTVAEDKKCITERRPDVTRRIGLPVVGPTKQKIGPGRHNAVLAMCWDDWLDGKREHVMKLLERV